MEQANQATSSGESARFRKLGNAHLQEGKLAEAADCYRKAIAADPDDANAHVSLGYALRELHLFAEAQRTLQQAIALDPKAADAHYLLGTLAMARNAPNEAIGYLQRAVEVQPDLEVACRDLFSLLYRSGHIAEAQKVIARSIALWPGAADLRCFKGNMLSQQGDHAAAVECYREALAIAPEVPGVHNDLGCALEKLGRLEEAEASYRQALALRPGYVDALVNLGNVSLRLGKLDESRTYSIERLFDDFADTFDTQLTVNLKYEVPRLLAGVVEQFGKPRPRQWDILDLGCGTGLVGAAIAPYARRLVGVDLSSKMLAKAAERNVYQRLENLDLLVAMQRESTSSYDLVLAADVFIYVGKLDELMVEARRLLRPGGIMCFSIEDIEVDANAQAGSLAPPEYQLKPTLRFGQSESYLQRLASGNGFEIRQTRPAQIRLEAGKPVAGHIVLWTRCAD